MIFLKHLHFIAFFPLLPKTFYSILQIRCSKHLGEVVTVQKWPIFKPYCTFRGPVWNCSVLMQFSVEKEFLEIFQFVYLPFCAQTTRFSVSPLILDMKMYLLYCTATSQHAELAATVDIHQLVVCVMFQRYPSALDYSSSGTRAFRLLREVSLAMLA